MNRPFPYFRHAAVLLALGAAVQTAPAQTPSPAAPAGPTLAVSRFAVDGELPLSDAEVAAAVQPFTGPDRGLQDIEAAAAALEGVLRDRGYVFHRIFIPAQRPVDGVIRLQVIQFKVGTVEVTGNEHFSEDNIRRSLPTLVEGESPEVRTLGGDVTASNTNPAKQILVTFKESRQPNAVDAVVRVRDAPPVNTYISLTGNQSLAGDGPPQNTYRITGGYQNANLFDRDHVLTLTYATDPGDIGAVRLFGAYYQLPLYGTGTTLAGYLTSSNVNSGQVQQGAGVFDVSGGGQFMGLRLSKALPRHSSVQQTVSVSLDERLFRNKTTFGGVPLQPDVSSRVLMAQYSVRDELPWGGWSTSVEYARNLGGGSHNTAADHAANGGVRNWDAWRFNAEVVVQRNPWQFTGRLRGQYSRDPLISGEQLGLGGTGSVRGFADRAVAGDIGVQWGLEALGPQLNDEWRLRPVLFIEGGRTYARVTGQHETIMSAGAGVRANRERWQLSADLARVLDRQSAEPTGQPWRLHVAASYRF